jgi:hypothetical protein
MAITTPWKYLRRTVNLTEEPLPNHQAIAKAKIVHASQYNMRNTCKEKWE